MVEVIIAKGIREQAETMPAIGPDFKIYLRDRFDNCVDILVIPILAMPAGITIGNVGSASRSFAL